MIGKDIGDLVRLVLESNGLDEEAFTKNIAHKLDINIKTLQSWITDPAKREHSIGRPYVAYLRKIFEPLLLKDLIVSLVNKVFKIAPSEFVGFWLRCGTEVILLRDSSRSELIKPPKEYRYRNDEVHLTLYDQILTIDAIQTAQVFNLTGDEISTKREKVNPHIMAGHLQNGACTNLLKIPLITGSSIGPKVVGLFDLQNKLVKDDDGKWVQWSDKLNVPVPHYSQEEIDAIRDVGIKEYNDKFKRIIKPLDYFDPETTPINGAGKAETAIKKNSK